MERWKTETLEYELVVCGGGLAGVCAAIAAARQGVRVGLLHDRTVLGGNSSSEVRVTPHGAAQHHPYARETGIISELLIEERAINHAEIFENGWTNSIWDLVLLTAVLREPNIELHLNTKVTSCVTDGPRITSVEALVLDSETRMQVSGSLFLDATGDGIVADSAGCEVMTGSEGRDVFGESNASDVSSADTMGNSLMFKTDEIAQEQPWVPPFWAKELRDPAFFYDAGRIPNDARGGFWWIELGTPRHTIYDNRSIRTDLQRYILGVWDWMKNHDPQMRDATRTRMLDWIGSVLGTRESRRIVGRTIVTESDIQSRRVFGDEIAYGGWFLDLHTPGGLIAEHSEANSAQRYNPFTEKAARAFVGPYGIPLSCLIARDVDNLFLAGRDISASHVALGTMRVMGTTALMGQAVGTAAAVALQSGVGPHALQPEHVRTIQQQLLRDGAWLPNVSADDPADAARRARISVSSEELSRGVEPDYVGWGEAAGIVDRRINPDFLVRCETRMVQQIALSGTLDRVSLCVSNHSSEPQTLSLALQRSGGIFDYTVYAQDEALAVTQVRVEPGIRQWITWERPLESVPGTADEPVYVRLELMPNPHLQWHQAQSCFPAHPAHYEVGMKKLRKLQHGVSLAFRVEPPQPVFGPRNVVSGVTRPHRSPNQWRSDPNAPLPAWCRLDWEQPETVGRIELTFPGNLLRSYHAYHPFYRAPETARDYRIEIMREGSVVFEQVETDNYQRRRVHQLDRPVTADAVRVTILSTNGDPAAGLYEVRVYPN